MTSTEQTTRYERGPLCTYEVTWTNGHVEHVQGHQCLMPRPQFPLLGESGMPQVPRWSIHGEFDGHWRLVLSARDEDIRTVRNLSHETAPGEVA